MTSSILSADITMTEAKASVVQVSGSSPLIRALWMYAGPIIFLVGLAGNSLILVVMTRRRMRGTSTSVYLSLMAVADLFVLLVGLVPDWLKETNLYDVVESYPSLCKPIKFLFYTSADASIWVLILFTVDRFIAICFPLHKTAVCTTSRAMKYSFAAFVLAVFKNIHVFWTRGIEYKWTYPGFVPALDRVTSHPSSDPTSLVRNMTSPTTLTDLRNSTMPVDAASLVLQSLPTVVKFCGNRLGYEYFENFVRPWLVFTVVYFVPFSIIAICNVFIVRALFAVRREHRERSIVTSSSERSMIQMTSMCVSASLAFIVCIAPSIVLLIGRPYWEKTQALVDAKAVNNLLVYVNHSINFFLYCVSGNRFRRMIIIVFHCRCLKPLSSRYDSLLDLRRTSLDTRLVYGITSLLAGEWGVGGETGGRGGVGDGRSPNGIRKTSRACEKTWGISPAGTPLYGTMVKSNGGGSGALSTSHAMLLAAHRDSSTPSPQTVIRFKHDYPLSNEHEKVVLLSKRILSNVENERNANIGGGDCYQMMNITDLHHEDGRSRYHTSDHEVNSRRRHGSDHEDSDYYSEKRCGHEASAQDTNAHNISALPPCGSSSCSGDCITCSTDRKTTGSRPIAVQINPHELYTNELHDSNVNLKDFYRKSPPVSDRCRRGCGINSHGHCNGTSSSNLIEDSPPGVVVSPPGVVVSSPVNAAGSCGRDAEIKGTELNSVTRVFLEQETTC